MNLIENGDFESGSTEPWTTMTGAPLDFEIVSGNNKKWLLTNGMDGPNHGNFQQNIPASERSWGNDFRLTLTAKAVPTGGSATDGARSDNDTDRLNGVLNLYFAIYYMGHISDKFGTYAEVSVKEATYSIRFRQVYSEPPSHAQLTIINWGGGNWDEANILVTDIKLELVDPEMDPAESAEDARLIDLTPVGLPKVDAPRMKKVR